jgi:hypothetical protein
MKTIISLKQFNSNGWIYIGYITTQITLLVNLKTQTHPKDNNMKQSSGKPITQTLPKDNNMKHSSGKPNTQTLPKDNNMKHSSGKPNTQTLPKDNNMKHFW